MLNFRGENLGCFIRIFNSISQRNVGKRSKKAVRSAMELSQCLQQNQSHHTKGGLDLGRHARTVKEEAPSQSWSQFALHGRAPKEGLRKARGAGKDPS